MAQRWPKRRGRAAAAAPSRIVVEVRTTTCARAGCKPVTVAGPQVWHVPIVLVPAAPGGRPARAAVCDVAAPANAFTHTIAGARPAVTAPGERAPLGAAAAATPRAAVADASTDATAADTAEADAHAAKRVVRGAAHAAVRGLAHAASLQRPAESATDRGRRRAWRAGAHMLPRRDMLGSSGSCSLGPCGTCTAGRSTIDPCKTWTCARSPISLRALGLVSGRPLRCPQGGA